MREIILRRYLALAMLLLSEPLSAQNTLAPSVWDGTVTTRVPTLCEIGGAGTTRGSFGLGVLVDTSSGLLRRDLSAPDLTLVDTWCNAPSQIEISAAPMTASGNRTSARTGFTRSVHYTATARGWSETPIFFQTDGAKQQQSATQTISKPHVATITVGVSSFRIREGSNVRPIADSNYLGTVLVTLRPTP